MKAAACWMVLMTLVLEGARGLGHRAPLLVLGPRRAAVLVGATRRSSTDGALSSEVEKSRLRDGAAGAARDILAGEGGKGRLRAVSTADKKLVAYRQKYGCAACGELLPPDYDVDHIIPVALNGSDSLANLQALCKPCHAHKTRDQRTQIRPLQPITLTSEPQKGAPLPAKKKARSFGLNPQQRVAVEVGAGPVRVVAGPGTGKTRVLTERIAELVLRRGSAPSSILALTFTNRAAKELRDRLADLLGDQEAAMLSLGTFHRVCLMILRGASSVSEIHDLVNDRVVRAGFVVYDQAAMTKVVTQCLADPTLGCRCRSGEEAALLKPRAVQARISAAKNAQVSVRDFAARADLDVEGFDRPVAELYARYEAALDARNAVDFDDMLILTAAVLRADDHVRRHYAQQWRHVLVDEFQDTNAVQYDVLRLLTGDRRDVFVVGDSDQAIYGWRGADYSNQRKFDEDFGIIFSEEREEEHGDEDTAPVDDDDDDDDVDAAVVRMTQNNTGQGLPRGRKLLLEQNYRSTQRILDAAMALRTTPAVAASKALRRDSLRLVGLDEEDAPRPVVVTVDDHDAEAKWVADVIARSKKKKDIGVLYRTNAQSIALEKEFIHQGIAHDLVNARGFFDRREVRDVMAYLRLVAHDDDLSVERVLNVPPRALGATTLARLKVHCAEGHAPTLLDAARGPPETIRAQARKKLAEFVAIVDALRACANKERRADEVEEEEEEEEEDDHLWLRGAFQPAPGTMPWLVVQVLRLSGLDEYYSAEAGDGPDRYRNCRELANLGAEWTAGQVVDFIDSLALVQDTDALAKEPRRWPNEETPTVKLMTIHASKGLEFDVVFVVGVDEGLIPHHFSLTNAAANDEERRNNVDPAVMEALAAEAIDEERRLLYVAMTRARKHLFLTTAKKRLTWGVAREAQPSRFIDEIRPKSLLATLDLSMRMRRIPKRQTTNGINVRPPPRRSR